MHPSWRPTGAPPPLEQIAGQVRCQSGFTWRPARMEQGYAAQTPPPIADELLAAAALIRGLTPDRRDPEQFHVTKSDVAARLAALTRRITEKAA